MARRTDLEAAKKAARKEENRKKLESERKKKQLKFAGIVVGAVAVVAALIVGIAALVQHSQENKPVDYRETIVMENSYAKIDAAMMAYYIGDIYNELLNANSEATLGIMGIDTSKKLNEMKYEGSDTWFDVLAKDACEDAAEWLAYCLAADKAGVSLTEDELAALGERASKLDLSRFADGMTAEDALKAIKIQALGEKYKAQITAENTADAAAVEAEINKNKGEYFKVSYRYYYIAYSNETGSILGESSDEEASDETSEETSEEEVVLTGEEALEAGRKIADAKTEAEFVNNISDFILSHFSTYTEESAKEAAETYFDKDVNVNDATLGKWLYNSGRKLYDTTVFDSKTGTVAAVMITSMPEFDAGNPTVDISFIKVSDEETARLAAQYASDCGSFEKAVMVYSIDRKTCFAGGKMLGYAGEMGDKALNDWIFGGSAKSGEVKIAEGNRCWYVVRYDGEGDGSVKNRVSGNISEKAVSDACSAAVSSGRVTKNFSKVNVIDY